MARLIIIRGAAGVGKSTVAKAVAARLRAAYVSFDVIMREHGLDTIVGDGIPTKQFLRANELVAPLVRRSLRSGKSVVLDGCFYRKPQLDYFAKYIPIEITLTAPLATLQRRNQKRVTPMPKQAVSQVNDLVARIDPAIVVETDGKTAQATVKDVLKRINAFAL